MEPVSSKSREALVVYVNGKKIVENNPDPETTLIQFLRLKLRLPGTKLGCAEGGCGACTVMVSRYDNINSEVTHTAVNACIAPVCIFHGMAVTTVEGIGSCKTRLHPVQEIIAKTHGTQCGFCTPGMVMSMYTLLRNKPQPEVEDVERIFQGNLCRCTGYRPILDAFKTFTKDSCCQRGEGCCKQNSEVNTECSTPGESAILEPTQELIFPPELKLNTSFSFETVKFQGERLTWYRPVTLTELLELKTAYPAARIVVGYTGLALEEKYRGNACTTVISATHVPELLEVRHDDSGIHVGGAVTITRLTESLAKAVKQLPEYQTRIFAGILENLKWFGGEQIRNMASVAGNILTTNYISDLNTLLMAAGCTVTLVSKDGGQRAVPLDSAFFLGDRKTKLTQTEILLSVHIPYTKMNEYYHGYKQAQRRTLDIAIVNAGMRVVFEGNLIKEMVMTFGGLAPITLAAVKTAEEAIGRKWDDSLVADACQWLSDELPLKPDAPGGQVEYRRTLAISLFFKFYVSVHMELSKMKHDAIGSKLLTTFASAAGDCRHGLTKSTQVFEEVSVDQPLDDAVGRPLPHMACMQHATGEAQFTDDMPRAEGELYLALVTSTRSHATIQSIDASAALALPGVETFLCHKDVPGSNITMALQSQLEIFASEKVTCYGQVIGAVVADTFANARRAAKAVKVEYGEDLPTVLTIEEAIEKNSFYDPAPLRVMTTGDVEKGFADCAQTLEGVARGGGQEHFYMETNVTRAIPRGEDCEMELFVSTQFPASIQAATAKALGVQASRVQLRVKRGGGGFGGKDFGGQTLTLPVAIAAFNLNRPVRCQLERDKDMLVTGGRHPFLGKYKVGFSEGGDISALELFFYLNAGHILGESALIMHRALFYLSANYRIPNITVNAYVCRTNLPSNTTIRAVGVPQIAFVTESIIEDVAVFLGVPAESVRELNMYKNGDLTHFHQPITDSQLKRCWDDVISQSSFESRKNSVAKFNKENRWKKRGISVIPLQYGMSMFPGVFLEQGAALVHVYQSDGSVLISHCGAEVGQGLHTKMIQVASRALNIPTHKIHISETNTSMVPNGSTTGGSMSSDLQGMAVINACTTIRERLEPYVKANPEGTWAEWVAAAYFDRVSLSVTGFYKVPGVEYDWEKNVGTPFSYFTYGAACTEVEIDCLTGDHVILRTDIVMDLGKSLNPALDIGQIEGAFMQGRGLYTLEQLKYSPDGRLLSCGPGAYKIPGYSDIPREFHVSLLKGSSNSHPRAVYSSKGIGEPPLVLALSVFFAIKNAIASARADAGLAGRFKLTSPATSEKIRMACEDQFTQKFPSAEPGAYKPWFVEV
ncbi:xanthine dehydrogenase/oxidase-like [Lingula anatina]|uniref:xanthine dehydrogenase n=1 Tax=Lingula anatina TaxID=7574 RepID=A0A1S3JWH2_LINAN|nr:xanthine dehydrogenase/oxidase-like [Lingula anatina]|eukprot:XP_013414652.1 xanthine dehydrogenase/oxidase-like [Lingula anatina]